MKSYSTSEIRNIALIGQKGAGKTSLAEAMLFTAKATTRLGRIDNGTTVLDFEPEEHKRLGSVQSAVASLEWNKTKVNVLDTPGERAFLGDTQNCLTVVEGAVVVVSGPDTVDPYTQFLFRRAEHAAKIVVVNQMGRERASFERTLGDCKEKLSHSIVPVTLPLGEESAFNGVVDLLSMRAHVYEPHSQNAYKVEDVPASLRDEANAAHEALLEEIAGTDEALMEKYLETGDLAEAEVRLGLKKAIAAGELCPAFAVDAAHNVGVAEVLDAIVGSLPAPDAHRGFTVREGDTTREVKAGEGGALLAIVFKTLMDQHTGKISLMRIIDGRAGKDSNVTNVKRQNNERFGGLLALQGKKLDHVEQAVAGDIAGVAKLKDTHTGDTLASGSKLQIVLPTPPTPQITYRIVPKNKGDEDKIGVAAHKLLEEDPGLVLGHDELTADMTISGAGVSHIDVALEKMARKYNVEVEKKPPLVPYRETITKVVKNVEGKHKKQSGGRGQFGVCYLNLRPLARGEGYKFVDGIVGGSIPRQFIPAVDKGIVEAVKRGVIAGYPVVDVEVEVFDGKYHDVDSSEMAFKIAGSKGFQTAVKAAGVTLIEPIMEIEVEVPEACLGDVMGNISSRRGRVLGMDTAGSISTIKAQVPMAELLTYAPDLKSMTGGRGSYTMKMDHYDFVPSHLIDRLIADSPHKPHAAEEE